MVKFRTQTYRSGDSMLFSYSFALDLHIDIYVIMLTTLDMSEFKGRVCEPKSTLNPRLRRRWRDHPNDYI